MNISTGRKGLEKALALGAYQAKEIDADQVVTAHWVRMKCRYGCQAYGKNLTCPPFAPDVQYTRNLLKEYKKGLLLTFRVETGEEYAIRKQMKRTVAHIERLFFLNGDPSAFGMSSGQCNLCDGCDVTQPCRFPRIARPSMEACGVDVFGTLEAIGLSLEIVTSETQSCTLCGLILFDSRA
jgi:predicted metal-binding protein